MSIECVGSRTSKWQPVEHSFCVSTEAAIEVIAQAMREVIKGIIEQEEPKVIALHSGSRFLERSSIDDSSIELSPL